MSKENQENFGSGKPKYLYLDKFNRYMLKTDTMLQNLESVQMKHTNTIRQLQKDIRFLKKNLIMGAISMVIMGILMLFFL